ncbi:hypothetical protein Acsp01_17240 [Actinoplanes sp. NBRC 101535]|nr:hypothetical protein Acsp01_17240 [Actinoplanes sp. NBRC 101535]
MTAFMQGQLTQPQRGIAGDASKDAAGEAAHIEGRKTLLRRPGPAHFKPPQATLKMIYK